MDVLNRNCPVFNLNHSLSTVESHRQPKYLDLNLKFLLLFCSTYNLTATACLHKIDPEFVFLNEMETVTHISFVSERFYLTDRDRDIDPRDPIQPQPRPRTYSDPFENSPTKSSR